MMPTSGRCHYHPERAGLGICVECRQVICRECTTQFEGINRCARCLEQKLNSARTLRDRREWSAGNVLLALLSVAVVAGITRFIALIISGT
ncbi:MAG TPA: hypothetical protein VND93_00705 [Myxococcales bacterium]|nr:hypothetical protein [Myxococcales bacterium]